MFAIVDQYDGDLVAVRRAIGRISVDVAHDQRDAGSCSGALDHGLGLFAQVAAHPRHERDELWSLLGPAAADQPQLASASRWLAVSRS